MLRKESLSDRAPCLVYKKVRGGMGTARATGSVAEQALKSTSPAPSGVCVALQTDIPPYVCERKGGEVRSIMTPGLAYWSNLPGRFCASQPAVQACL